MLDDEEMTRQAEVWAVPAYKELFQGDTI